MKHEFDAKLLADERAAALARRAAAHLDAESEGTAIPAEATWRLPLAGVPSNGAGPSLVEVEVRDATGAATIERLGERDLDENNLRYRMTRYWGNALAARFTKVLKQMTDDGPPLEFLSP